MSTSLFLLFKEYADVSKATSATYIEATPFVSSDEALIYFDRWIKVVRFFCYERCNRYYDSKNIENALYPYKLLEKEYSEQDDEYPTAADYLAAQFASLGLMDWREETDEHPQESYFYYECDVTPDTFGEMARHKKQSKAVVLLNCSAVTSANPIELSSSSQETIFLDYVKDIPTLYDWFCKNRSPQRIFDYNPKHGDENNLARIPVPIVVLHNWKLAKQKLRGFWNWLLVLIPLLPYGIMILSEKNTSILKINKKNV